MEELKDISKGEDKAKKIYGVLGANQSIRNIDVEQVLGTSLQNLFDPESIEEIKKTQHTSQIFPDGYLNSMSAVELTKYMDHHFALIEGSKFTNVNQNYKSKPGVIVHPKKVEHVQVVVDCLFFCYQKVRDTLKHNRRLRVVGRGHSWTPVFPENDSVLVILRITK